MALLLYASLLLGRYWVQGDGPVTPGSEVGGRLWPRDNYHHPGLPGTAHQSPWTSDILEKQRLCCLLLRGITGSLHAVHLGASFTVALRRSRFICRCSSPALASCPILSVSCSVCHRRAPGGPMDIRKEPNCVMACGTSSQAQAVDTLAMWCYSNNLCY